MAIRKLTAQLIKLTPDVLADFAQAKPLPGERSPKKHRLAELTKLIEAHRFIGLDWHRGRCLSDNSLYRFDGQHTTQLLLHLLAEKHPDFPYDSPVTLTDWEFDSVAQDATHIFNIFNNPMSVRSNTDMMQTYQAFFPDLAGLDPMFLIRVLNGIAFYEKQQYELAKKKGIDTTVLYRFDARDMGMRLENDADRAFILWVNQFQDTRLFRRMIGRQGLIGRMYGSRLEKGHENAERFWRLVLSESAPNPDDETRLFAETLKRMVSDRKKVTQEEFYKEASKAWRRYKRALGDLSENVPVISQAESDDEHSELPLPEITTTSQHETRA